ncbi:MAG TPA: cob(I)yrinic acid a,c-diamide adenosyltransferase [Clostridiales bacterium]|nr:cob(I)yrinic acid a,c-diamide adenosyltransferase [Clostridiales bacterium]
MEKGYIQVYTGDGKGKTTAALGLAFRAIGGGFKVIMIQFLKGRDTGELHSIEYVRPHFEIYRFCQCKEFFWHLSDIERNELKDDMQRGLAFIKNILENNMCDLLILDEIIGAVNNGLLQESTLCHLLDQKPQGMEVVITGRDVPKLLAKKADLITEMKQVKHYMNKGVKARKGIEY